MHGVSSHLRRQRYVALKVCAADADSQHELKIFNRLPHDASNVVRLLDSFSLQGPNGFHTILVQNVLGQPTTLMRSPTRSGHRVLCQQLTLHRHGIHPQMEDISILEFPVSGVRCPDSDILGNYWFFLAVHQLSNEMGSYVHLFT